MHIISSSQINTLYCPSQKCTLEARGNGLLEARGNSLLEACGNSLLEARGNGSMFTTVC